MKHRNSLDTAAAAWARGLEPSKDALAWLRRARRLAPDDPRIALDLARALLAAGQPAEAGAEFAPIAKRHDIAAAWTGLALAEQSAGNSKAAAKALAHLLTRHCLAPDPNFTAFALHVATQAGFSGVQQVTPTGEIILHGTHRLLGARADSKALNRVEGLVAWEKEGLSGWACRPAWPDEPPCLVLADATGQRRNIRFGKTLKPDDSAPLLPRHSFRLSARQLHGLTPPFALHGPDGANIMGSPLDPRALASPPIPAAKRGKPPKRIPPQAPLALLMPVYRGLGETKAALASVLAAMPADARLIVVDDASPDPALSRHLRTLAAAEPRLTLLVHAKNQGFCAAVNTGLAEAAGRDVLLLNSDILLPPGAIGTLRDAAYADAATGTVTPLSNEASICSYPARHGGNAMPDLREATRLDTLARQTNGAAAVEIPTGVGFCMYIRHDCLTATGGFRDEIFAQGYGEENDFCLRARHLGYRHMAAAGAYVAHVGGISFRAATRGLMTRNGAVFNRLYPGYHEMILEEIAADRLYPYRAALDEARLRAACANKRTVLLISHSHGGGVARQMAADLRKWRRAGYATLLLVTQFPTNLATKTPYPWPSLLCTGEAKDYPNLTFSLPTAMPALLALLRRLGVEQVMLHHTLGHDDSVRALAQHLGVAQDIVVHDYASFCPRVTLLRHAAPGEPLRYCGEPNITGCISCRAQGGDLFSKLPMRKLLARSTAEFAAARRVITPSEDVATRIARHFPGVKPCVQPWENDAAPRPLVPPPPPGVARNIAVIGGIGPAKGFDVLLDCAADATSRNLPLTFSVIGGSADDARLLEAGVFVTAPYREGELPGLLAETQPHLAFLPSICPETWCFTLGEAWAAGLPAIVFGIGAQAERVKATGRGLVLPLGLPAARINDLLLSCRF
ncbi:glycosyltransferase [Acidocella aromatica]|uniref:GT2 family glycosyltransferase/glycosyltransferase involved in cell wall biosynthesis n=1 Tax=Acidocella aromatica TaxID=1303579 RepID=A0A840V9H5_9PROT|nr:GT2 family glycosyltransferase/glycosyltransferase involved in cell wall biosynthesis [Acidocella aromatica]